jgi:small subunit ribosomal protein S13
MPRISGVNLPRNKRIEIGLTYIFGVGKTSADKIIQAADIDPSTRCKDLTDEQVIRIRAIISKDYQTEGDLRRSISQHLKRLTEIGTAAGRRHRVGLPVRGQRTRTNARTRKGKIKIPVSRKK